MDCRWDSERFSFKPRFEAAGILCVFQGFNNAGLDERIRCAAAIHFKITSH